MKKIITKGKQITSNNTSKNKAKINEQKFGSKKDHVIHLLKKSEGLDLPELIQITGWQAHSVRGFISGTLRKKLNLNIILETSSSGGRKYRIATEA